MAAPDRIVLGHEIESQFARARNYIEAKVEIATVHALRSVAIELHCANHAVNNHFPARYWSSFPWRTGPIATAMRQLDYTSAMQYCILHRRLFY